MRTSSLPTGTMEQRIHYCRVRSGLTFAQLADAIGVHPDYCPMLEKKADRISPEHFIRLCRALSADPAFILYGSSSPPLISLPGNTIAQRLRAFRGSLGLSQRQMAYRVTGEKRHLSIGDWESGKSTPELRSLLRIADAFGISALSFL